MEDKKQNEEINTNEEINEPEMITPEETKQNLKKIKQVLDGDKHEQR